MKLGKSIKHGQSSGLRLICTARVVRIRSPGTEVARHVFVCRYDAFEIYIEDLGDGTRLWDWITTDGQFEMRDVLRVLRELDQRIASRHRISDLSLFIEMNSKGMHFVWW